MAKAIPEHLRSLTAQLSVDGCMKAMEWYGKAFGAEEITRAPDPTGQKIWHAMMRIGDSTFFVNDVFPEMGGKPSAVSMWIYGDDIDARFERAVQAGATVKMPVADMFWGDRMGTVMDPWGNQWCLAQHTKDMTHEEIKQAQDAFVASMKK